MTVQTSAVTVAPTRIEIREVEVPVPDVGEALVAIEVVGVCGTDAHIFDGSFAAALPLIQGHEFSGIVEHLPDGYRGPLAVGERVAALPVLSCGSCYPCRIGRANTCSAMRGIGVHRPGALQQRLTLPVENLYSATGLSPTVAALCEPLSVGQHALMRAGIRADDDVVVLGAGPVGLAAVLAAADAGARVLVLDRETSRLKVARVLGADEVVDDASDLDERVAAWTGGHGATLVVEATGAAELARSAFDLVGMAGRIVMVGISEQRLDTSMRVFTAKELDVYGARSTNDFAAAIDLARRHAATVDALVSHRFPLSHASEAMMFVHDNPHSVIKALIEVAA